MPRIIVPASFLNPVDICLDPPGCFKMARSVSPFSFVTRLRQWILVLTRALKVPCPRSIVNFLTVLLSHHCEPFSFFRLCGNVNLERRPPR